MIMWTYLWMLYLLCIFFQKWVKEVRQYAWIYTMFIFFFQKGVIVGKWYLNHGKPWYNLITNFNCQMSFTSHANRGRYVLTSRSSQFLSSYTPPSSCHWLGQWSLKPFYVDALTCSPVFGNLTSILCNVAMAVSFVILSDKCTPVHFCPILVAFYFSL